MPEDREDRNARIVAEFRAHDGVVEEFGSVALLLLHHTGARSGTVRVNPLAYQAVGEDFAIFGSKGGSATNPDWYHNLVANPAATIEVGTETIAVRARVLLDEERSRVWEQQKVDAPDFAAYEARTSREIPVILLERA